MSSVNGAITFPVCYSMCWQNTPTKPCQGVLPFWFAILDVGRIPWRSHVQCLWCHHLSCLLFKVLAEHPEKPCPVFMVLSPFLFAILGAGRTPDKAMSSVYGAITFLVCCSRCWQKTLIKPWPVFMVLSPFLLAILGAILGAGRTPDKAMSSVYGAITFLVCCSRCWQNTLIKPCPVFMVLSPFLFAVLSWQNTPTKPCPVFRVLSPFLFAILGAGRTPRQSHVQCLWC